MEEVDKIIIQSLTSIGCEISPDVKLISQFDQDLFIESVSRSLNLLLPQANEQLPTRLPPNTGVKFRICTKFANICQQLGYKNEIGYQTFLYSNETDMRRLLIFLVEKLTKEVTTTTSGESGAAGQDQSTAKSKNLNFQIAHQIKLRLNQIWLPPYCKLIGIRFLYEDQKTCLFEGSAYVNGFHTFSLASPQDYLNPKSKYYKDAKEYTENYCNLITKQAIRDHRDILASLLERNLKEKLKELSYLKQDINGVELKKSIKEKSINELRNALKVDLKRVNDVYGSDGLEEANKGSCLSRAELAEIEKKSPNKNLIGKGSRFTHSEKLQFTKDDETEVVSIATGSSQEKKEEEIKNLKETFEKLNQDYEGLEKEIKNLSNLIQQTENECKKQEDTNKKIIERITVKQKTVNLINDAPMNILKLKEEIKNHEKKMVNLKQQWEAHKKPYDEQLDTLKQSLADRKLEMQKKVDETKSLRQQIEQLNIDLTLKEKEAKELSADLEKIQKESNKTTNRQFYTRRILEIVANIDKQKKEIDKILIETRVIQKEINQLSGKLERIFNANDELIFKDAKKDETNKKIYKLFIGISDNYEKLISTIEDSSHIEREIRDLEDQVTSESQNKIDENIEKISKDYKQIKEENEQLISKVKSNKK